MDNGLLHGPNSVMGQYRDWDNRFWIEAWN